MEEQFKTMLAELGIKPIGISKMESDGVTDEEALKARLNELRTIERCKDEGGWVISKGAFANLLAKFPLSEPAVPAAPSAFATLVAPLCKTTKLEAAEVAAKMADLGDPDELIEYFNDGTVTLDLLIQLFGAAADKLMQAKLEQGLKKINETIAASAPTAAPEPTAAPFVDAGAMPVAGGMGSFLPQPLSGNELLAACQVGGIAKIDGATVAAATEVYFANQIGVFGIKARLVEEIDRQSEDTEEPWPQLIYDLRAQLLRRSHGDLLTALGVGPQVVTKAAQDRLLKRLEATPDILSDFHAVLKSWWEQWQSKVSSPGALMQGIASMMQGGGIMSRALMAAPDHGFVSDSARHAIDRYNKVFAGPGIPVALSLAEDAAKLTDVIKNPQLRTALGVTTHEDMVRKLGIAVSAEERRIQTDVTIYVQAIYLLAAEKVPGGPQQVTAFLDELYQLGERINFERLSGGRPSGTGRTSGLPKPRATTRDF